MIAQREDLYSEFTPQGTACYAKALSQSLENLDEIVSIYALVNRIRLFASASLLEAAEAFANADPLNDFALWCRVELREIYERTTWRRR